jgi:hypothetical protein
MYIRRTLIFAGSIAAKRSRSGRTPATTEWVLSDHSPSWTADVHPHLDADVEAGLALYAYHHRIKQDLLTTSVGKQFSPSGREKLKEMRVAVRKAREVREKKDEEAAAGQKEARDRVRQAHTAAFSAAEAENAIDDFDMDFDE